MMFATSNGHVGVETGKELVENFNETQLIRLPGFILPAPDTNWISLFITTRRLFCEYVSPVIPVLSRAIVSSLFDYPTGQSSFVNSLRTVSVAATVPFLTPYEHSSIG